ncbi:MAG: ATP-binding cassette domain-containing protein [Phycisphaeraceae bacterium]|nr:MAG: ATP-binding cassette domain-containing protein [Phycisphaeraceae bacterium]
MPLISAINIHHHFGEDIILEGATLVIEAGERVGMVGRNGTGKSTLMRAMAGALKHDSGDISVQRGCRVGYLHQDPVFDPDETLRDAAEGAFAELHRLHIELNKVYEAMAGAEGAELERLLRRQERLDSQVEAAGGYTIDHKIDATLHGLGFTDEQFSIRCCDLSGGQKARLALARLLLESPDALLLDEPTNHLDINGRLWLEDFLVNEYRGAVLMISHDRYMLDRVVSRIVEVEQGRLIEYPGNYEAFRKLRRERRITMARAWEKQQTDFKKQEEFIRRFKEGQRAKQARGRESILERRKRDTGLERPIELDSFRMSLPKAPRSGDIVVAARGVSKRYTNLDHQTGADVGEKVLFHELDVTIGRGERWGIIGPNGAGKSTLVRCLLGEQSPDAGSVRLGSNVVVGHFKQTSEGLNPDQVVYRAIQSAIKRENPDVETSEQMSRDLAGAFLFSGDEQEKPVGVLSGGEKSRVRLAALLASARNLLVLDEPTNHLDIPGAERLEEALTADPKNGGYEGTLLLISHDRAIIDAVCDHLLVLDGEGNAETFVGGWTDWRRRELAREQERQRVGDERKKAEQNREKQQRAAEEARKQAAAKKKPAPSRNGLERMSTTKLEERIEQVETRIKAIDAELADPEVWRDARKSAKLGDERAKLAQELEPLEFEWSRRAEEEV